MTFWWRSHKAQTPVSGALYPAPLSPTFSPSPFLTYTCINKSADTTEKKRKVSRLEGKTHLPADTLLGYINTKTQSHTHSFTHTHILTFPYTHSLWQKKQSAAKKNFKKRGTTKREKLLRKRAHKNFELNATLHMCVCVCVLQQQLLSFPNQAAFFTVHTHSFPFPSLFVPAGLFCFAYFSGLGIIYDRPSIKLAKSAAWKMAPSAALIRHLQQREKYKKRTLQQGKGVGSGEALPLAGIPCELLIFSVWFQIVARGLSN